MNCQVSMAPSVRTRTKFCQKQSTQPCTFVSAFAWEDHLWTNFSISYSERWAECAPAVTFAFFTMALSLADSSKTVYSTDTSSSLQFQSVYPSKSKRRLCRTQHVRKILSILHSSWIRIACFKKRNRFLRIH